MATCSGSHPCKIGEDEKTHTEGNQKKIKKIGTAAIEREDR